MANAATRTTTAIAIVVAAAGFAGLEEVRVRGRVGDKGSM